MKRAILSKQFDLFHILGITISVDVSWFLVLVLVSWTLGSSFFPESAPGHHALTYFSLGLCAALLLFASVLLHELAHSGVANRYGLEIRRITLFLFGGVAQLGAEPQNPAIEARVAIAGPLSSLSLAVIFWALAALFGRVPRGSLPSVLCSLASTVNVGLAVFNLIPGFPLDGGRLLRAHLWHRSGSIVRATKIASRGGKIAATAFIGFGIVLFFLRELISGLWLIFIGLFLHQVAEVSYFQVVMRKALDGKKVSDAMRTDFPSVHVDTPVEAIAESYLLKHRSLALPVADDRDLVGFISYKDVKKIPKSAWRETPVGKAIRPGHHVPFASPGEPLLNAYARMTAGGTPLLAVVEGGYVLGILSRGDVYRIVRSQEREHAAREGGNNEG